MDFEFYVFAYLLNFREKTVRRRCIDNEFRTLVSILLKKRFITSEIDCPTIIFGTPVNNQLKPESSSRSLQWLGSELQQDIKINEPLIRQKITELNFLRKRSAEQINTIYDLVYKNINLIIVTLYEKSLFLKIGGLSSAADMDDYKITIENSNYNKIMSLIYGNNTPHISTFYRSWQCPQAQSPNINSTIITATDDTQQTYTTTIYDYFNDEIINKTGGQLLFYNILATELVKNSRPMVDYISNKKFVANNNVTGFLLINLLFQLIYTLNIFEQYNFIHHDLHDGNIFVEKCDKPVTNYYVITDDAGKTDHLIKLESEFIVKIIDFDHSFFLSDTDELNSAIKRFDRNALPYVKNLERKFDIYYIFKWIERSFDIVKDRMINSGGAAVTRLIISTLYNIEVKEKVAFVSHLCHSTLLPFEIPHAIAKGCLETSATPSESMNHLLNFNGVFLEQCGIRKQMSLQQININKNNQIFFYKKADILDMRKSIYENNDWLKLDIYSKCRVCWPLVSVADYGSGIKQNIKSLLKKNINPVVVQGGTFYEDKYLKYKNKYLSMKKN